MTNNRGRWRFVSRVVALVAMALGAPIALTQPTGAQARAARESASGPSDKDQRAYNKRDFNGLYSRNPTAYGLPDCPECRDPSPVPTPGYGYFGDPPARTPAGELTMQARKTGRGLEAGSEEAKKFPNVDPAYKRAVLPAFANDPEARCEPLGLPRIITMSGGGATMEMVHTQANDRIIQKFEWSWDHRDIWMDGRQLPKADVYLPSYIGYSVGKWEGDTLVVTSTGFDDRQWVDMYGFPISETAILVERWERPTPNRLRLVMTLTDPVNYTRPWTSGVKVWGLIPKDKMSVGGWSGILEDRCVPSDEAFFNKFRDHAAGIK